MLAICCIILAYPPGSGMLADAAAFYAISATLDLYGTVKNPAILISRREASVTFRHFAKRWGRGAATAVQILIEATLILAVAPHILGHPAPSVPFMVLAGIVHLYGFLHNARRSPHIP